MSECKNRELDCNGWRMQWMGILLFCLGVTGCFFQTADAQNASQKTVSSAIGHPVSDDTGRSWFDYDFSKGGVQLYESDSGKDRFTLGGSVFMRGAYWNWFEGSFGDNEYTCGFQRTRVHFNYQSKYVQLFVEPQYVHMFGVPDDAFKRPPEGPLGMGGLYYFHNKDTAPHDIGLHQGYAVFHTPGSRRCLLKAGRFEYSDGLEVLRKKDGKAFNTLKNIRLGDRMISSFGWSAFGRSFNGGLAQYDHEKINVTGSFFFSTQGGWEEEIDTNISDIRITTCTITAKRGEIVPGMEFAAFYYNYRDGRDVHQRVDNTLRAGTGVGIESVDIDIHMVGGHILGMYPVGPGRFDILLWGGGQFGDWYELDQQAYAVAAEIGYQFTQVYSKPWIRAGYYIGSGDDSPGDDNHGTFFQMAPGTRKYNLLPYCDLMNVEDVFAQVITHPLPSLMVRVDYHFLRLNEEKDRWYMGSGPTQKQGNIFGYIGRPSNGQDNLSQEVELMIKYDFSRHWRFTGSYCHIFGGDVVENVYPEDENADYASIGAMFIF